MTPDAPGGFWEQREQDARIRKASRMVPTTALSPRDQIDVLQSLRAHLSEFNITHGALARALGVSETYISRLLGNDWNGPPESREDLLRRANNWIEEDYARRLARRPDRMVETRAAKLFFSAARSARQAGVIGVVTGPAGIGKTTCATAFQAQFPETIYVYVDVDSRGVTGLREAIAEACRTRRKLPRRPKVADLVARLKGSGRLLIIDQAHDLLDGALRLVANLHDQCELPILLVGTVDIHQRVRDDQDPEFGQFSSRVGLRMNLLRELARGRDRGKPLSWISIPELRAIFEHQLKLHPDAARLLAAIANAEVGHLRRAGHLMRLAAMVAEQQRHALIERLDLLAAIEWCDGPETRKRYELLAGGIEKEATA